MARFHRDMGGVSFFILIILDRVSRISVVCLPPGGPFMAGCPILVAAFGDRVGETER